MKGRRSLLTCCAVLATGASAFAPSSLSGRSMVVGARPLHRSQLLMSSEPAGDISKVSPVIAEDDQLMGAAGAAGAADQFNLQRVEAAGGSAGVLDPAERTKNIDDIFYVNSAIVSFLVLSAVYQLTHTHVGALAALWEYDLGPHPADMTKLTVAVDLLARLPFDLVHKYEALVPTNPIFYKACTSGVAYGLGDFISQVYQGKTLSTLDLPRSFRSGAAGFLVHGPLCHFWLLFMETYLDFDGAWWATGIKVTADLTVWSIFLNAAYSTVIGTLAGRSPKDVLTDVRATQWPALRSAWRFWPFVHTVSFSHAVPLDLKLLWVDFMEVIWVTILSKVANEDKNAKLAEDEVERVNLLETAAVEEGAVPEVNPALEIELTRELEADLAKSTTASDLSFELPKKVLGACWPLIAMWPVLYVGFQAERALGII
eukprot:CAMPEP_0197439670 /NCGR_PEP_ID=MMETSP1175-20131217/6357_1 /TAXON_ID=1003142 /ORGANISM="Triceratium dubium, Strain CCMP147" /LENGTH=428 /DNA_ID=CAMNT_0042969619 /DNA_START=361 /DNA_END=1647 /DNA_ORIENTATION=+